MRPGSDARGPGAQFFSKCGIIKEGDDKRPRIKIYRDRATGMPKGDGLVTYLKEPSVRPLLGHSAPCARARFSKRHAVVISDTRSNRTAYRHPRPGSRASQLLRCSTSLAHERQSLWKIGGCARYRPPLKISTSLFWDDRWRWRAISWMARASVPTPARRSASRWGSPEPCNPAVDPSRQDHNELGTRPWLICKLAARHVCLCRSPAWGCQ